MVFQYRILSTITAVSLLSVYLLAESTNSNESNGNDEEMGLFEANSDWKLNCKGRNNISIYARLDKICEDCYNLYRNRTIHKVCRQDCFTSEFFKGCLQVLYLQDQEQEIQKWIQLIHGAEIIS